MGLELAGVGFVVTVCRGGGWIVVEYLYIEGDSWRESVDIRGGAPSEKNSRVKSYNSPSIINQLMQ
jgi:hypothetical protein